MSYFHQCSKIKMFVRQVILVGSAEEQKNNTIIIITITTMLTCYHEDRYNAPSSRRKGD